VHPSQKGEVPCSSAALPDFFVDVAFQRCWAAGGFDLRLRCTDDKTCPEVRAAALLARELGNHALEQLQYLRADADSDSAAEFGGARPIGLLRHGGAGRQPKLSLCALVAAG
jgi:hypothetical protein